MTDHFGEGLSNCQLQLTFSKYHIHYIKMSQKIGTILKTTASFGIYMYISDPQTDKCNPEKDHLTDEHRYQILE